MCGMATWYGGTIIDDCRARAHRQGRGLPARRNEGRDYPGIYLMGVAPRARKSDAGMPRGRSLYGSIPDQLDDETSFVRQLQAILAVRRHYGIATSTQIDIPDVSHKGMLVLVHQLGDPAQLQLTVLNFADEPIAGTVRSEALPPGGQIKDMFTNEPFGTVDDLRSFAVGIEAHHGMSLLVRAPDADPPEA